MSKKTYLTETLKKFIKEIFTKNILLKVTSMIITLFLWFMVIGSRNIEMVKNVPLTYLTPQNLVVANEVNKSVELRLLGPRAFLREVIEREDNITIDLRNKGEGYVSYKLYDDIIDLPIGVKVVGIYPETIMPKLEKVLTKKVQVVPSLSGELSEGYKIKETKIEPNEIEISGPENLMKKTDKIYTAPMDISTLKEPTLKEVELDVRYKNVFTNINTEKFSVFLDIVKIMSSRKFNNVKVFAYGPKRFKINPSRVDIYVEGPKLLIDKLSSNDIRVTLDLTLNAEGSYQEEVQVKLPKDVRLNSVIPKKVSVWIY